MQEAEFVGREPELAVLDALLGQVRTEGARVVLIRGMVGIGKTALVREFLRRHGNLMVMRGSGDEGEAAVSYTLADQLFGAVGLRSAALLAHTERVLPVEEPVVVGRQVLAVLTRCSAQGPMVVVIDDANWADVDSLRALLFALRRLAGHPVLTIVVVPSDDSRLPAGLERLAEGHTGTGLDVGPLAPGDVAALATAVTRIARPGTDRSPPVRPHAGQSASPAGAAGRDAARPLAGVGARAARAADIQPDRRPPTRGLQRRRTPARRSGRRSGRGRSAGHGGRARRGGRAARGLGGGLLRRTARRVRARTARQSGVSRTRSCGRRSTGR